MYTSPPRAKLNLSVGTSCYKIYASSPQVLPRSIKQPTHSRPCFVVPQLCIKHAQLICACALCSLTSASVRTASLGAVPRYSTSSS
eukprot:1150757-Pelagomonas_calceolata.AAC.2